MKSEKSVEIIASAAGQRSDRPTICLSTSTSASCEDRRCNPHNGLFEWRHVVIVAVIAGVFPSAVFFGFLYATHLPCDCSRLAAEQVERLLREQFPSSVNQLSSTRKMSSLQNITSSDRHLTSSADVNLRGLPRRRVRRQSSGGRQNGRQTRTPQPTSTRKPKALSNRKCPDKNSCNDASGIHLEFSIPALNRQVIDRLQRINGSTESVDYGEISHNGFKPHADMQNGTRYSFRNWKPATWFNSSSVFKYDSNRGTIKVLQSGLYYVYSQIRFYHTRPWSYAVMVNDETILFKCIDGTAGEPLWQFSNCHIGGLAALKAHDQLWLKDMYGERTRLYDYYIHLDPALGASSFWGAIHLGKL